MYVIYMNVYLLLCVFMFIYKQQIEFYIHAYARTSARSQLPPLQFVRNKNMNII